MPKTYELAGVAYASRKAVEARCRELLHGTPENEPLEGDADAFMRAVVARHPHAAEKIGPGIRCVYVVQQRFSRAFFVRRTDGTEIDFSYKKSLDG